MMVVAGICALGGFAVVGIAAFSLEQKGAALETQMQEVADTEAHQQEYLALMQELAETETERAGLSGYILDRNDGTIELLSRFDTIAAGLGLELITSKLEVVEGDQNERDTLLITLESSGTEASVQIFLQAVETVPYHGYITAAEVVRGVDGETGASKTKGVITLALSLHDV